MIIYSDIGQVEIDIPDKFTKVGIRISGGADSALMTYLLALYKKYYRPDIQLVPLTCVNMKKPYNDMYAPGIVEKITSLTGVYFEDHIVREIPGTNANYEMSTEIKHLYDSDIIECHFMGETMNPPTTVNECFTDDRVKTRDFEMPLQIEVVRESLKSSVMYQPLRHSNKRQVAALYEVLGVTEVLFPLTRSCEFKSTDRSALLTHCGNCWWCNERRWGFGRLI